MLFIKNHFLLFTLWMTNFFILIFFIINFNFSKLKKINNLIAISDINKKNSIVIDVRKFQDYEKGHIINSLNISMNKEIDSKFQTLKKYKKNNISIIIVNSHGENFEIKNFVNCMYKAGFQNIKILKSGISGWYQENLPLTTKN